MKQYKRILVLLEDLSVRREVIQYAMALALRINARITLLMLLPNEASAGNPGVDPVAQGEGILEQETKRLAGSGVPVQYEVIRGDPRSEFIKFMATNLSFHTAVWGGDPVALRPGSGHQSDHWISTIGNQLDCPLVAPTKR
jgi:nucleotide-binding universal stress UspA family protein